MVKSKLSTFSCCFFSKILGCHELSRKHIHDFKRPMNQNLDFPLPPKCPLGIIEKSVRERIDNVVVKTNYQQSVADFSKTPHHELSRKIYTIWNDPWTKIWAIPQAPKCPLGILENRFDSARIPGKIILGLTNIPHTDFGWRSGWTKTPAFFLNFIRLEIFIGKLSARTASPSVKKYNRGTIWPNVTDTRSWKVIHGDVP